VLRARTYVCMRTQIRTRMRGTHSTGIDLRRSSKGNAKRLRNAQANTERVRACVRAPASIRRMHFFVEMTLRASAQHNLPRIYNLHEQSCGDID